MMFPCFAADDAQIHLTADAYEFGMDMRSFSAEGNVKITRGAEILTAESIHGDLATGDIYAKGNVHFQGIDKSVNGDTFEYNFISGNGIADQARVTYGPLIFSGKKLKAESNVYTVENSLFTTCNLKKPHYHLAAKEIIIKPNQELIAYGTSLHFLKSQIISIPKYRMNLSPGGEKTNYLPVAKYSKKHGFLAKYNFELNSNPDNNLALELMYSTKSQLQGGIHLDRWNNQPLFASITHKEPVSGGIDPNAVVSKLPEIGYQYSSDPKERSRPVKRKPLNLNEDLLGPNSYMKPTKKLSYTAQISTGRYMEHSDTKATEERFDLRTMLWYSNASKKGTLDILPAAYIRYSSYGNGDSYKVAGLKLAAGKRLGSSSYVSLGYISNATEGKSPFSFDSVELKKELAGSFHFKVSDVNVHVGERYDLKKGEIFNSTITLTKTFHCIESSITWRNRFKDLSLELKLAGF